MWGLAVTHNLGRGYQVRLSPSGGFLLRQFMTDEIGICIQANKLSKGTVRRFFEALNSGKAGTNSLSDDDESFNVD